MSVYNTYVTDSLIRRQVYIERLKTGKSTAYAPVSVAIRKSLLKGLAKYGAEKISDLNKFQLASLIKQIDKDVKRAEGDFIKDLLLWLRDYSFREAKNHTELLNRAIDAPNQEPPKESRVWAVVKDTYIAALGLTVGDYLKEQSELQRRNVSKLIRQAYTQAWTTTQLRLEILGRVSRNFKDGLVSRAQRAIRTSISTVIQHAASLSRFRTIADRFIEFGAGYEWVSILDSKTSRQCRGLDGQRFQYGEGPLPPIHPNCRSHVVPFFRDGVSFLRGLTRKTSSGVISSSVNYYEWLKTQSKAFQNDVLGPTRAKIFRSGKISASEFARLDLDKKFKPITLDELERKRPELFDD